MTGRLQGKVAFITGGGSGIGAATARRFAQEGATVVVCGRRRDPLDAVVDHIAATGGKAEAVIADVSDEAGFTAALEAAAQRHGRLDVLVNNAMAYTWGSIEDMSTTDWHANFATSVDGTFWGTRTAMRLMKGKGGAIVNVSSICGSLGTPWMAGYSAAKAAIDNFSRAAAAEGAAQGVRVNVVIPAVVETPATAGMLADENSRRTTEKLIPMGRVGQPEELANAILFLASDEASYITGASLPVDGGRSSVLVTAL
ncbi:SDR family NAD(P)-dependent oxidoreductase [Parazoarcus communis]|uniref:SDR family NAD(P)-dependent oxidoreductase n=1 Tax=Parazoarcus communis SWub3 = DSM 12120 TaxID=1121029 RepID=A0A323V041_9RHOO|nr:SDR family NAD(P)-dependent oxidoreductase [Parazoarcus communis]NMG69758.1 glucose 1-dehydrogenase [Parazoarcus communis SWub3 = DSM 12120]PZA18054.1 SDR family NAD(P)-dependent oxidoreductase [Azoarcus communis] [Parazoarcus communis SWub3 = DSM 12120]